jgi:nucleoid-associated protein YgaU
MPKQFSPDSIDCAKLLGVLFKVFDFSAYWARGATLNRFAILGAMGVAVIVAALLLNYAINRDEVADNNAPAPTVAGAPAETPTLPATTTPPAGQTASTGGATTGGTTTGSATGTGASTGGGTTPPSAATTPPTTPGAPAAGTPPAPGSSGVVVPSFDIVRVNPDGGMVIAGRAAPHSTVTVTADNQRIGSIVADDRGEWVLLPDTKLAPGNHQLAITAQLNGGTAVASDDVVVVVVPQAQVASNGQTTGQTQSQTQTTASNQPTQPLAVVVPRNSQGGSTVLQSPAPPQSGLLILQSVDYDTDGKLIIGGQAPPGEEVRAYLDNRYLGVAKADQAGRWHIKPEDLVAPGLHNLRIDEVDANGKVVARVESPFSRAQPVDVAAGNQVVVVQPGNSLWLIASRTYGSGFRYTVIYQANKGQITDPDLIYPGQVFKLPTTTQ